MLDIKDEYIRDYSFDPEFIKRKDSLDTHMDRLEKTHVLNKRKHNSIDIHNMIDAEVTVIISSESRHESGMNPWKFYGTTCEAFMWCKIHFAINNIQRTPINKKRLRQENLARLDREEKKTFSRSQTLNHKQSFSADFPQYALQLTSPSARMLVGVVFGRWQKIIKYKSMKATLV